MWHILYLKIWPIVAFERDKRRLGRAFQTKPVVVDKPVLDWYIKIESSRDKGRTREAEIGSGFFDETSSCGQTSIRLVGLCR